MYLPSDLPGEGESSAHVHLIEYSQNTYRLLRAVVRAGNLHELVSVHHAALSNASGQAKALRVPPGSENKALLSAASSP